MLSEMPAQVEELMASGIVWDNHACMPLRPDDLTFLPQLARYETAGVDVVILNICIDLMPPESAFLMLASFRQWIGQRPDQFILVDSVADIDAAKSAGKLAIAFNIEGGRAVEAHPGLVDIFYRLGVRWMLIAYNRNNRLGGGCQDADGGLSDYGRSIIDEMERVGMVLCCSHTGYRTAFDAIEYSNNPVIFSHSNPRKVWDHDRNIPDDLMLACAKKGGVISMNGIGVFLGENDSSLDRLIRHIDYSVGLVGAEHVGVGLDYIFDSKELDDFVQANPALYPPEKGYQVGMNMIAPEAFPLIAEALLKLGYKEIQVRGILGENNFRIAKRVWR